MCWISSLNLGGPLIVFQILLPTEAGIKAVFSYMYNHTCRMNKPSFAFYLFSLSLIQLALYFNFNFDFQVDYAFAFRYPNWPEEAAEWRTRNRTGLDQTTVDNIASRGCYLVHRSHSKQHQAPTYVFNVLCYLAIKICQDHSSNGYVCYECVSLCCFLTTSLALAVKSKFNQSVCVITALNQLLPPRCTFYCRVNIFVRQIAIHNIYMLYLWPVLIREAAIFNPLFRYSKCFFSASHIPVRHEYNMNLVTQHTVKIIEIKLIENRRLHKHC